MPEDFPKPPVESKEGGERPPAFKVYRRSIFETYEDGSTMEYILECDGHAHRRSVDVVWHDEHGVVVHAKELAPSEIIGPCDGKHS